MCGAMPTPPRPRTRMTFRRPHDRRTLPVRSPKSPIPRIPCSPVVRASPESPSSPCSPEPRCLRAPRAPSSPCSPEPRRLRAPPSPRRLVDTDVVVLRRGAPPERPVVSSIAVASPDPALPDPPRSPNPPRLPLRIPRGVVPRDPPIPATPVSRVPQISRSVISGSEVAPLPDRPGPRNRPLFSRLRSARGGPVAGLAAHRRSRTAGGHHPARCQVVRFGYGPAPGSRDNRSAPPPVGCRSGPASPGARPLQRRPARQGWWFPSPPSPSPTATERSCRSSGTLFRETDPSYEQDPSGTPIPRRGR